jgi:tetratricopeptide (TPR) repeat protein
MKNQTLPTLFAKSAILLFLFYPWILPSTAEQTMDSGDALTVAEFTAYDRTLKGSFTEARQAGQNALKIAENRYGPTHPSLVPILDDLATIDRYLALYPEAESNLQWALAIREKKFGMEDPLVAQSFIQLASLYFDWGHWEDAEFFQKKAVTIFEKKGGESEDLVVLQQALELLGQIELQFRKTDEALSLLKKSLELASQNPGTPPARLVEILNLLAFAYQSSSRASDEQSCLEKALQVARSGFKANSIEVAEAMKNLADFYHFKKRDQDAKSLCDSVLKIAQGCVGSYFGYSSLPYVQKLAKADEAVGLWKEAEDLLQKALQTSKETFGANHPRAAVALLDLAGAQEGLGQRDAARENLKQALEIAKSFYRDDYPLIVQIQKELHK